MTSSKVKGLLLFSGGLDSLLAAKVLMEQNIDITGIHFQLPFSSPFDDPYTSEPAKLASSINLKLRIENPFNEYIEMLKNPPHGYGKNMNPCIDCKILFLKLAGKIMKDENFDFIATGEVNGQRPMSQKNATIRHIENSTGLKGYILRPLSAKFFPKTIAEEKGLVDSTKLLNIHGRGRTEQLKLVKKYNLTSYSSPAGGCLLTDENYSKKLKDLFLYKNNITRDSLYLLTIGRHFRDLNKIKFIISRNEKESNILEKMKSSSIFVTTDFSAPVAIYYGDTHEIDMNLIAGIITRYGKPTTNYSVTFYSNNKEIAKIINPAPIDTETINKYRVT